MFARRREGSAAVSHLDDLEADVREQGRKKRAEARIVVDQKNMSAASPSAESLQSVVPRRQQREKLTLMRFHAFVRPPVLR
jgi:hypothetical protein